MSFKFSPMAFCNFNFFSSKVSTSAMTLACNQMKEFEVRAAGAPGNLIFSQALCLRQKQSLPFACQARSATSTTFAEIIYILILFSRVFPQGWAILLCMGICVDYLPQLLLLGVAWGRGGQLCQPGVSFRLQPRSIGHCLLRQRPSLHKAALVPAQCCLVHLQQRRHSPHCKSVSFGLYMSD